MVTLITSYKNPDLDGFACMYAYAEFLKKKKFNVNYKVFGIPRKEARFVIKKNSLDIKEINEEYDQIILVDASDKSSKGIPEGLDANKVIEVIDHRENPQANEDFPNAKIQIELVGACATLIAEKFFEEKKEISKESAVLLYSAIVWNTVNFKNKVTTKKDIKIANWLKTKFTLSDNYIYNLFSYGSDSSINELFFANFEANGKKIGIAQLETVNVEEIVKEKFNEIEKLLESNKKRFDYIILTCIDLEKGFNLFVAIDEKSKKLVEKVLKVKFSDNIAQKEGIIMRKEIMPKVKEYLENH